MSRPNIIPTTTAMNSLIDQQILSPRTDRVYGSHYPYGVDVKMGPQPDYRICHPRQMSQISDLIDGIGVALREIEIELTDDNEALASDVAEQSHALSQLRTIINQMPPPQPVVVWGTHAEQRLSVGRAFSVI